MNVKIQQVLCLLSGILLGYFLKGSHEQPPVEQQYGSLRIPVLDDCIDSFNGLTDPTINSVKLVYFDMDIQGLNANQYIKIGHVGYPSKVMSAVHKQLKNCIPDTQVTYDNDGMLAQELHSYFGLSATTSIHIVIKNGKAYLTYKK